MVPPQKHEQQINGVSTTDKNNNKNGCTAYSSLPLFQALCVKGKLFPSRPWEPLSSKQVEGQHPPWEMHYFARATARKSTGGPAEKANSLLTAVEAGGLASGCAQVCVLLQPLSWACRQPPSACVHPWSFFLVSGHQPVG